MTREINNADKMISSEENNASHQQEISYWKLIKVNMTATVSTFSALALCDVKYRVMGSVCLYLFTDHGAGHITNILVCVLSSNSLGRSRLDKR